MRARLSPVLFLLLIAVHARAIEHTPVPPEPAAAAEETSRAPTGDFVVLGGGAWPQGSTTEFSDAGWNLNLRLATHLRSIKGLIPTLQLGGTFFPQESRLVDDYTDTFIVLAEEETDRWAGSFNLGLQLGSPTRHGFFRPRAGIAPGFYTLAREVQRTLPGEVDPYYTKTLWLGRLGWKGIVGADFFVSRMAGIALEFVYDQVWDVENGQSARYQGFALGVTFAMEQFDEPKGTAGEP